MFFEGTANLCSARLRIIGSIAFIQGATPPCRRPPRRRRPLGGLLGASWGPLGASWARLVASWARPGASWGAPWGLLGASWARLGASWARPGLPWGLQGAPEPENTVKTMYFHVFCRVSGGPGGPPKFVAPGSGTVIFTGDGKRAFSPIVVAFSSQCDES